MPQTSQEIVDFYIKQICENAEGIQAKVCATNGISLNPTSGADLRPIPVYEECPASLLKSANLRTATTILWPANQNLEYLRAYFKKYKRDDGHSCNQIVVTASNYCEARFFAAKELMHCLTDDDGYPASNSVPLVNDLIESLAAGGLSSVEESPKQTIVDQVAWLGAAVYLVPKAWHPLMINICAEITAKFPDANAYLHIAQIIRVPEIVLRLRLRDGLKGPPK